MKQKKSGILVLVSAPSGGGKNVVIRKLMERYPDSIQLVTTTTRPAREGEKDGVDYYFFSKPDFEKKLGAGGFVEYNEYNGNYYGTERAKLEKCLKSHGLVFSQAEVHGKQSLDRLGVPHVSVFLLPESMDVLRERIQKRGGVRPADIEKRLAIAKKEIEASATYDLRVVNKEGRLKETVDEIASYIDKKIVI